jgi:hypothetical protein
MIESFVEPGERVIWTDRFDPARPRRRPMTFLEIIGGEAKILIGLVCLAATALLVAILDADPQTRLLALLAALILTPAAWLYGRRLVRLLKVGAIEKVDFLLTHRRVLALEPRMRSPEVLEVERISGVNAQGNVLVLSLINPDDIDDLRDIGDIEGALRAFNAVIGSKP